MIRLITVRQLQNKKNSYSTKQCLTPGRKTRFLSSSNDSGLAGIAIILVTLIVSLATIVVVNSTYSTFLSGRSVGMVERQIQAEYILKSLINFAAGLIGADQTNNEDGFPDIWGKFIPGIAIPEEILAELGMNFSGVRVYLEINPLNSRLPLDMLSSNPPTSAAAKNFQEKWKEVYVRLFEDLGFNDNLLEPDQTGTLGNQPIDAAQLVDHLEHYQMRNPPDGNPNLPSGMGKIQRIGELINIPGFTPNRIRALTPYVFVSPSNMNSSSGGTNFSELNVNVAIPKILRILDPETDPTAIDRLVSYRDSLASGGEIIDANQKHALKDDFPGLSDDFLRFLTVDSKIFKVIGKVEFGGGATYFISSIVSDQGFGKAARVHSMHMY